MNIVEGQDLNATQSLWPQPKDEKRLIRTPVHVGHMDKNLRREDTETHHPRSPKSEYSFEILQLGTCTKRQDTEEDNRDVQVKKRGNIWVQQPLPPHLMYCINSAGYINEGTTLGQYSHSSQHTTTSSRVLMGQAFKLIP